MNQAQTKQLLTALFTERQGEEPACHSNQAELVAYVEAELAHGEVATLYPALHHQLATCPTCRLVYEELRALLAAEVAGTWQEPPPAAFDLTFLETMVSTAPVRQQPPATATAGSPVWSINALGQLLLALSAEFLATLQFSPQPAYLKSTSQPLFTVTSPPLGVDLAVTVAVSPMRRQPESCTVTVTAAIPGRSWPDLGGIPVTIQHGEEQLAAGETDAFGQIVFSAIPRAVLAHLQVAVAPRPV